MLKAKKIGLILDKEVGLEISLKNGNKILVATEFIDADYDRLYLRFPDNQEQLAQYFYSDRTVQVILDTFDGRRIYPAKILYEPQDGLIVVEYNEETDAFQKRMAFRVRLTKLIDIEVGDEYVSMPTIDISAGGCKFLSPIELKEGVFYDSYLHLQSDKPAIRILLKIRQIKFLSIENKYEISAEFQEIKEVDRKKVAKMCYDVQTGLLEDEQKL